MPAQWTRRRGKARSSSRCSRACGPAPIVRRLRANCGRSIARCFRSGKSSYQDEKATWSMMDLKHTSSSAMSTADLAGLALGGGGAGLADRLRERVEPAHRARHRAGARNSRCALRSAPRGRAWSATCWRRAACSRRAPPRSASCWRGRASLHAAICGATLLSPHRRRSRSTGPSLWLLAGLTTASALLFGLVPAVHGTGGRVDESLRSGPLVNRQRGSPAPSPRAGRGAVRDCDATAGRRRLAAGEPQRTEARRSRLRRPQRADRSDPAAGGAVSASRAA